MGKWKASNNDASKKKGRAIETFLKMNRKKQEGSQKEAKTSWTILKSVICYKNVMDIHVYVSVSHTTFLCSDTHTYTYTYIHIHGNTLALNSVF